jgi:hypothetical protein
MIIRTRIAEAISRQFYQHTKVLGIPKYLTVYDTNWPTINIGGYRETNTRRSC